MIGMLEGIIHFLGQETVRDGRKEQKIIKISGQVDEIKGTGNYFDEIL